MHSFISFKKQPVLSVLKTALYCLFAVAFATVVTLNVVSSQSINPLYFDIITEKKEAVVKMLGYMKKTPQFHTYLALDKSLYGNDIETAVFSEELNRKTQIDYLDSLLKRNENARDVLVNLSILHYMNKDLSISREYEDRARALDPKLQSLFDSE